MKRLYTKYKVYLYMILLGVGLFLIFWFFNDKAERDQLSSAIKKHYFDKSKSVTVEYLDQMKRDTLKSKEEIAKIDEKISEIEEAEVKRNEDISKSSLRDLSDMFNSI